MDLSSQAEISKDHGHQSFGTRSPKFGPMETVFSKNGMMIWASTAKHAVMIHSKCGNSELKCVTKMHQNAFGGRALPEPAGRLNTPIAP